METLSQDRLRVLIVDDQPNWLETLYDMLDPTKYEIETATNYDKAKLKLKQRAFHVIVTDQRLVDVDETNIQGIHLLDKINEFQDGTRTIVVTGYGTMEIAKKALQGRAAFDYLLKCPEGGPFNIREYRKRVEEAANEAMGIRESKVVESLAVKTLDVNLTRDQIAETLFFEDTVSPDASKNIRRVLSWLLYPLQPLAHQTGKAWLSESDQTCEFLCWSRNYGGAALIRIGQEQHPLDIKMKWFSEESRYLVRKSDQYVSGQVAGVSYVIDEMTFEDFEALVEED